MFRRLPVKIALAAGLAPALLPLAARAQVNIDAGKTPAEIYASDCATCHKTPRGLAAGRNTLTLSIFLREHYTASTSQASALAAYVLGAGGAEPTPKQKPEVEHARAEEPKNGEPKPGEPKTAESKPKIGEVRSAQPKPEVKPVRAAAKPDERRDNEQSAKLEDHPAPAAAEDRKPDAASQESKREPAETAPIIPQPAPIAAAPGKDETPAPVVTPSAPAAAVQAPADARDESNLPSLELGSSLKAVPPAEDRSSATETVPRDNIPD